MKQRLKIKVCGMRDVGNVAEIAALGPDYMGFIFCQSSKRYVGSNFRLPNLPSTTHAIGVFVDEPLENLVQVSNAHGFALVQLHGTESPEYCRELKRLKTGMKIIKALPVASAQALPETLDYQDTCDFFLFDTKTLEPQGSTQFGGSGKTFDWQILKSYKGSLPFFVAGGLGLENMKDLCLFLQSADLPVYGVDINSSVETGPAMKSVALVKSVLEMVRT